LPSAINPVLSLPRNGKTPDPVSEDYLRAPQLERAGLNAKIGDTTTKVLAAVVSFALIAAAWPLILEPFYAGLGFRINTSPVQFLLNLSIAVAAALLLPARLTSFRDISLNLLYYTYILPIFVYSAMQKTPYRVQLDGISIRTSLITLGSFVLLVLISAIPLRFKFPASISARGFRDFIAAITVAILIAFVFFIGFGGFNIDLGRVYEFRDANTQALPSILLYLWPLVARFLLIYVIFQAWRSKDLPMIAFALVSLVLFIGFTNQKNTLWFLAIAGVILMFNVRKFASFYVTLNGLTFIALLLQYFNPGQLAFLPDMIVRRTLATKAMLTDVYIDLFSDIGHQHWAFSKISFGLTDTTHPAKASIMVGDALQTPGADAGTGWIGAGYAELGLWGVGLETIVVGLILAVGNTISPNNRVLIVALAVFVAGVVPEADVFAAVLNWGVGAGLILALAVNQHSLRPGVESHGPRIRNRALSPAEAHGRAFAP